MDLSGVFGQNKAAQFNAARTANDTFVKPQAGSGAVRAVARPNFATAMASAIAAKTGGADPNASADALQQTAQQNLNAFHKQLVTLLAGSQVNLSQPIRLESDGQGGVQVAGNNPDAGKIMSVLHDHPELVSQFQSLAKTYQQLRAANPLTAAEDSELSPPEFGVTFTSQQVQAAFA
jgi:hypothetical protein